MRLAGLTAAFLLSLCAFVWVQTHPYALTTDVILSYDACVEAVGTSIGQGRCKLRDGRVFFADDRRIAGGGTLPFSFAYLPPLRPVRHPASVVVALAGSGVSLDVSVISSPVSLEDAADAVVVGTGSLTTIRSVVDGRRAMFIDEGDRATLIVEAFPPVDVSGRSIRFVVLHGARSAVATAIASFSFAPASSGRTPQFFDVPPFRTTE